MDRRPRCSRTGRHRAAADQAGAGVDVAALIGTNAEEMNLYLVSSGVRDASAATALMDAHFDRSIGAVL